MGRSLASFGRVVDVIFNEEHPRYREMGGTQSLHGVFYRVLGKGIPESRNEFLDFAYCGNLESNIPLKGEIILLEVYPSEKSYSVFPAMKTYWTKIIPIWNHPQHGILPDILENTNQLYDADPGFGLKEDPDVKPVERKPGERVWEGRWGQYVKQGVGEGRFSKNSSQDPFFELEVGKIEDSNSKIVITSNHTVDIPLPSSKFRTHRETPLTPNTYNGLQTVLDSNLISILGRRQILLSSKESLSMSSNNIHIDGEKEVGIDGIKIYLGESQARTEKEANLKGTSTVEWLKELTEVVSRIVTSLSSIPPDPVTALPIIIQSNTALKEVLPILNQKLENLKSKKIFVE